MGTPLKIYSVPNALQARPARRRRPLTLMRRTERTERTGGAGHAYGTVKTPRAHRSMDPTSSTCECRAVRRWRQGPLLLIACTLQGVGAKSKLHTQKGVARSGFLEHCNQTSVVETPHSRLLVLDVGANDGSSTRSMLIECSKRLAGRSMVQKHELRMDAILFEPNPRFVPIHAKLIADMASLTPPWNVTIVTAAVSTQPSGNVTFYISNMDITSSMVKANAQRFARYAGNAKAVTVPTLDFSAFLNRQVRHRDLTYLKLDVESTEWELVPHLLRQRALCRVRYMLIEWHLKARAEAANMTLLSTFTSGTLEEGCGRGDTRVVESETDAPVVLV